MTIRAPKSDGFEAFLAERNRALETLDMAYAAKMMPAAAPEVRLMAMHKARYECTAVSRTSRLESGAWLRKNNVLRLTGTEPLPEGELPE